ncbi:MAG: hypothetical protein LUB83_00075 [Prevotellaceae bacterium]|nr:hypothetical protein [Prevotellaceae bacterium]
MDNFVVTFQEITPEIAQRYLGYLCEQRNIRRGLVERYVAIMDKGGWKPNPSQPLVFSNKGHLLNGQHRLNAVVKSGKTVVMAVMHGVDEEDFSIIDTGGMRTPTDMLTIKGVENASMVSAIVSRYLYLIDSRYDMKASSRDLVLSTYLNDSQLWQEIVRFASRYYKRTISVLCTSEVGGIYAYLVKYRNHSREKIESFFNQLFGDENIICPVIRTLRNRLLLALKRKNLTKEAKLKCVQVAWNMFIKGSKSNKLVVDMNEVYKFN